MHLFSSHWSEISRFFPLYPILTPKETTETKQSALKVHSYSNTSGSPVDLCIVYLWPRIKDAMTAAKGPIGFQTIWGLALVANIIRQWHPGQLKRCGVRTGPKKTREFLPSQNISKPSPLPILQKQQKKPWKIREIVLLRPFSGIAASREKKYRQLCASKKGEGCFPKDWEGIAGTAIKTR